MNNLVFDDLRWLHLLWVVLGVVLLGLYGIWQRRRAMRMFAAANLLRYLTSPVSWPRALLRLLLVTACLVALVAGLLGPRWGEQEQQLARRNIDVMVLLDVSRSMLARDIAPNRLERAKLSIRDDLLPALGGDRIGLITFAGEAVLTCPLTNDYGFFRLALDDVSTRSAARGGTLIGDAIRKAAKAFPDKLGAHRIVLLITDGEDHDSEPVQAAAGAWEDHQLPIIAVALGDEREGARIPVDTARGEGYLEYQGKEVWSKANFDDLRQVTQVAGGSMFSRFGRQNFIPVGTRNFDLGEIYRDVVLPAVDAQERLEAETVPLPSRTHLFALAALGLLLIDSLLRDGPRHGALTIAETHRERGAAA
ncbi:MAG: VWA domain-containing protein [Phycisphaerae bacterium]